MSKIKQLREEITERQFLISKIQDECTHPTSCLTRVAKSDTGNYDSTQDSYWYEFTCGLCDKHWSEDQRKYNENISQERLNAN